MFGVTTTQTNCPDGPSYIGALTTGQTSCPNPGCGAGDFECSSICDGYQKWTCFPNSDCSGCDPMQIDYYCEMHVTCP